MDPFARLLSGLADKLFRFLVRLASCHKPVLDNPAVLHSLGVISEDRHGLRSSMLIDPTRSHKLLVSLSEPLDVLFFDCLERRSVTAFTQKQRTV
jgi:hypothetical protein